MAGLPWIQLAADWKGSKKAIRLRVFLADEWAWAYVVSLWCWTAQHAGDGRLEGAGVNEVVAEAAGWKGDPKGFVEALVRAGLLDETDLGYRIHDWQDYAGAHIAKRLKEQARLRTYRKRTGTVLVPNTYGTQASVYVHGETETETEREREIPHEPASQITSAAGRLADKRLEEVAAALARNQGCKSVGLGKDVERVRREFSRWLDAVGVEATVAECLRLASDRDVRPHNLSWYVGWLQTVPQYELDVQRTKGAL